MVIKNINRYKKDASRVIIYFEDRTYITVDLLDAERLGLRPGMDIDEELLPELADKSRENAAYCKAAQILGRRSMSRGELIDKLTERGFSESIANKTAARMSELAVIDDMKYAVSCVQYYENRGFGMRRIQEELYRRKIPAEYIERALEKTPEPFEKIEEYIQRKLKGATLDGTLKRRMTNALLRRGFEYNDIRRVMLRFDSEDFD